jgi:hypothetical protein
MSEAQNSQAGEPGASRKPWTSPRLRILPVPSGTRSGGITAGFEGGKVYKS